MTKPSICCVVPTIRQSHMEEFRKAWAPLFEKHNVTLITVWDGMDRPKGEFTYRFPHVDCDIPQKINLTVPGSQDCEDLIYRCTDARRNVGFIAASNSLPDPKYGILIEPADYILTLDDDVHPPAGSDPIQEHLDVLQRRVPISWMNTAIDYPAYLNHLGLEVKTCTEDGPVPYLRGFPYGIRDEAPVMVSHGVWVNVPDFDGRTQLELTNNGRNPERLPYSLPYFRGPVPKGCYFPFCGMNVMVRREALPYLYFAPMGPDTGIDLRCDRAKTAEDKDCPCDGCKRGPLLNRFADIWCGILLKRACDSNGWAIYTGASTVIHTRASDPFKNVEQERLGIEWNEMAWKNKWPEHGAGEWKWFWKYWSSYLDKAARFRDLIRNLQGVS